MSKEGKEDIPKFDEGVPKPEQKPKVEPVVPKSLFSPEYEQFFKMMQLEMDKHQPVYGDSWRQMDMLNLYERLKHKMEEYELTQHPKKLISLANLAMLLFLRTGVKFE